MFSGSVKRDQYHEMGQGKIGFFPERNMIVVMCIKILKTGNLLAVINISATRICAQSIF